MWFQVWILISIIFFLPQIRNDFQKYITMWVSFLIVFLNFIILMGSCSDSCCRLDDWRNGFSSQQAQRYFSLPRVQTSSVMHPPAIHYLSVALSLGMNRSEHESGCSTPYNNKVKNAWSFNFFLCLLGPRTILPFTKFWRNLMPPSSW